MMPPILAYLPKQSLDGQTTHYAVGPAGYAGAGGVLPAELVGFDRGAETVTANYSLRSGPATLTIIDYPTPQMAMARRQGFATTSKAREQQGPAAVAQAASGLRPGLARGAPQRAAGCHWSAATPFPTKATRLLATVHFEADLTRFLSPRSRRSPRPASCSLGITVLVIIGVSAAILLGFFLGGGRALYRMARGKPISSVYDEEFIRIDLREEWVGHQTRRLTSRIRRVNGDLNLWKTGR